MSYSMAATRTRYGRPSALAMPRRRGASAGVLLALLGIWGAIIPFVGPTFGYRMDTAGSWVFTWDRLWLCILPGAAALIGGLILISSADRLSAAVGAWLAFAGGVWFVVGPTFSLLWGSPIGTSGIGVGSDTQRFIEQIGYFYGLGAVLTALAAGAWARVMIRSERDAMLLEPGAGVSETVEESRAEERTLPAQRRSPAAEGAQTYPAAATPVQYPATPVAEQYPAAQHHSGRPPAQDPMAEPPTRIADEPPRSTSAAGADPMASQFSPSAAAEDRPGPSDDPMAEQQVSRPPHTAARQATDPMAGHATDPEAGRETPAPGAYAEPRPSTTDPMAGHATDPEAGRETDPHRQR